METISQKICLVGDFGVGKTSLIRRFVERQFSDEYLSTVGVKISRKTLEFSSDISIRFLIWDLEGSTKFMPVASSYLQGAMGAIVVADITRLETLERISYHIDRFFSINPESCIVVALNKSDLLDDLEIEHLIQRLPVKEHQGVLGTYLTSAKTGKNVDKIFEKLAYKMIEVL